MNSKFYDSIAEAAENYECMCEDWIHDYCSELPDAEPDNIAISAEYQGKKVTLYKPFYTPDGPAKFAVYVKPPNKNVKILRFGSKEMSIKRDQPERLKSFRARFKCNDGYGPKWEKKYWNCKTWEKNTKVSDIVS